MANQYTPLFALSTSPRIVNPVFVTASGLATIDAVLVVAVGEQITDEHSTGNAVGKVMDNVVFCAIAADLPHCRIK